MTFSIVAIDKQTGEIGFAISSCSWDSGRVGRAEPGVGAIVSQAWGNMAFKDAYVDKLEDELTLPEILDYFKSIDPDIEHRQIGMITQQGDTLSYTGSKCGKWAGYRTGPDYACQGNILTGPEVVEAMSRAYKETRGDLIARLLAALTAGDEAGGDRRGKQSARLKVMKKGVNLTDQDTIIDIDVEDHTEPVKELARILQAGLDIYGCWRKLSQIEKQSRNQQIAELEELEKHLREHETCSYYDLWNSLAWSYYRLGYTQKAVQTFRKCLMISPRTLENLKEKVENGELPAEILE